MQHRPARLAALTFLFCGAQLAWAQTAVPAAPPAAKPKGPTTIDAEKIEGVSELEVTAQGKVEFQREDLTIYSEYLRYNQEFGRVEANGGVRMLRGGNRYFGPRLRYNTQDGTGVFEGSNFIMPGETVTTHGTAERLEFLGQSKIRTVNGTFTSCEPGKEDWRIEAREYEIDSENHVATIHDGRLKFYDTTVMPVPYGSFSLDNQRKSGILSPYYSHSTTRGIEVSVPYYWNIAPERDLIVAPTEMTKRGEQLKTDLRFMGSTYRGEMRLDYMPHDNIFGSSRYGFSLQQDQQITPGLRATIDYNKVSDYRYFVDLSSQVRQISTGVLPQQAALNYSGAVAGMGFYVNSLVQQYQTLQDPLAPITPPYNRLPQINFGTAKNDIAGRFDLALPAEYVRFASPAMVDGARVQFNPTVTAPILAPGYFLTPKLGLHYANYNLTQTAAGQPEKQSVSVPWASLDGGLVFDRETRWFGKDVTQTFEPRMFYVYAPYRNQDQVPIFDTGLADFNFTQLFTENRFAGGDRFGDANQLTMAATSRLLTSTGQELMRATFGQRYYFSSELVGLTPTTPPIGSGASNWIASIGGNVKGGLALDGTIEANSAMTQAELFTVSARYAPEIAKVISASFRYNREVAPTIKEVDFSGQWPVRPGWYAIGRLNYSFEGGVLVQGIAGMEYNAGCWVFRTALQRLQTLTQTSSTAIFFQLELNGFGSVGSDEIETLLRRNVPGYAVTNPMQGSLVPPSMRQPLPFGQVF
ncbi:MAG TPA: LPS-assembly protein LptD [Burkholderiales bacterium]|nr:LPS-assembly protein LptD [Burkholderiales bacterium]